MSEKPDSEIIGAEPKPKVVVLTEEGGRRAHYSADGWDAEEAIDITRGGRVIATYPAGRWIKVADDDAELPDERTRALGLAKAALRDIWQMGGPDNLHDAKKRAGDALEEIWAETEL